MKIKFEEIPAHLRKLAEAAGVKRPVWYCGSVRKPETASPDEGE